jgi:heme oxygenase
MASASPVSTPRTRFSARAALREATADAHARVDTAFGGFGLDDATTYRRFLQAQAAAFLPTEAALDGAQADRVIADWPQRRRGALLEADLATLGASAHPLPQPVLSTAATICGAVYVLEGSRLGGAMLVRGVAADLPTAFLRAPAEPGAWRGLLDRLDTVLPDEATRAEATQTALIIFDLFARAAEATRG